MSAPSSGAAGAVDPAKGVVAQTDMGWKGEGPWTYRLLHEPHLTNEFDRQTAPAAHPLGGGAGRQAYSVTTQPCPDPEQRSQDRHVVASWALPGGSWTFAGVFDGHAGHDTVDYTLKSLPSSTRDALSSILSATLSPSSDAISAVLSECITRLDQSLTASLLSIFPGGEQAIKNMTDDEIKGVINDQDRGGKNAAIVARCMRGTTALVALIDPQGENLWVASLGDCVAVLGASDKVQARTSGMLVSSTHNGRVSSEADRVRSEHPGEDEAVLRHRVLGAIAVTRALGDHLFKLPAIYTTRVFVNAAARFRISTPLADIIPRIKTPPYVSATPDVRHVALKGGLSSSSAGSVSGEQRRFLIMCSDGLVDLFDGVVNPDRWARVVGGALSSANANNAASSLLRHAFGGDDDALVSCKLTVEMCERWMDDTTIVVVPL
ncbi:protein serine threonine phosphatase 2C [Phellopilus nigrolimitatus]|nr:protein serine threonine phosphatase 2C [Phellopilus nigrolimitatus]